MEKSGTWHIISPPSEKVWEHVPYVPHHIAPMISSMKQVELVLDSTQLALDTLNILVHLFLVKSTYSSDCPHLIAASLMCRLPCTVDSNKLSFLKFWKI